MTSRQSGDGTVRPLSDLSVCHAVISEAMCEGLNPMAKALYEAIDSRHCHRPLIYEPRLSETDFPVLHESKGMRRPSNLYLCSKMALAVNA